MTDSYTCPQDGCDFGESENKSLAAVRGHISAASGHDWDELKADLYAQAEDANENETEEGDPGEVPGPDGETGHLGSAENDDEQTDDNDDEMATQEEYEQQYEGGEPTENQQDVDNDGGADGGADGGDDSTGFHIPAIGGTTLLAVAGVLLVAFIAWRVLGDSGGVNHEPAEEQVDTDDSDTAMVDIEAGTGGVST